jgi:hypothetical protein
MKGTCGGNISKDVKLKYSIKVAKSFFSLEAGKQLSTLLNSPIEAFVEYQNDSLLISNNQPKQDSIFGNVYKLSQKIIEQVSYLEANFLVLKDKIK